MKRIIFSFINNYSTFLTQLASFLLAPIGVFMFSLYIYFRFIRPRLPQDIPLNLTEFRFYNIILLYIIYIYINILIHLRLFLCIL